MLCFRLASENLVDILSTQQNRQRSADAVLLGCLGLLCQHILVRRVAKRHLLVRHKQHFAHPIFKLFQLCRNLFTVHETLDNLADVHRWIEEHVSVFDLMRQEASAVISFIRTVRVLHEDEFLCQRKFFFDPLFLSILVQVVVHDHNRHVNFVSFFVAINQHGRDVQAGLQEDLLSELLDLRILLAALGFELGELAVTHSETEHLFLHVIWHHVA